MKFKSDDRRRQQITQMTRQMLFKLNLPQMQQLLKTNTNENVSILHLIQDPKDLERVLILAGRQLFNKALLVKENEQDREPRYSPLGFKLQCNHVPAARFLLMQADKQVLMQMLAEDRTFEIITNIVNKQLLDLFQLLLERTAGGPLFDYMPREGLNISKEMFLMLLNHHPEQCQTWWSSTLSRHKIKSEDQAFLMSVFGSYTDFIGALNSTSGHTATFQYQTAWFRILRFQQNNALQTQDSTAMERLLQLEGELCIFHGKGDDALRAVEKMRDVTSLPPAMLFDIMHLYHKKLLELQAASIDKTDAGYCKILNKIILLANALTKKATESSQKQLRTDTVTLCNMILVKHYNGPSDNSGASLDAKTALTASSDMGLMAATSAHADKDKAEQVCIRADLMQKHAAYQFNEQDSPETIQRNYIEKMRALLASQKLQIGKLFQPQPRRDIFDLQTQIYSELAFSSAPASQTTLQEALARFDQKGISATVNNDFYSLLKEMKDHMQTPTMTVDGGHALALRHG